MDKTQLREDNTYTLNQLVKVLGCNRNTAEKKMLRGNYQISSITYNNRSYPAYIVTVEQLKKLDFEISTNKEGITTFDKRFNNREIKEIYRDIKNENNEKISSIISGYNDLDNEMLRNIKDRHDINDSKIVDVVKENNALNNKVVELKANIKDLSMEKVKLEADLYKAQADIKLIEDKKSSFESAWAEKKQEVEKLKEQEKQLLKEKQEQEQEFIKEVSRKNKIIILLSAVIGAIIVISATVAVMLHFLR